MVFILPLTLLSLSAAGISHAAPTTAQQVIGGPSPGIYGSNSTKSGPLGEGNTTFPPHSVQNPSGDDVLLQNLLAAEWIVADFYRQGVEYFNQSVFTQAGFENNTLEQLTEIYQNENGHLAIFKAAISDNVTKPGKCTYDYGFQDASDDPVEQAQVYMGLVSVIEVGSLAYLTGLAQSSVTSAGLSTIMGAITVEARHLTWVNSHILGGDTFVGPSDTVYPYATQILSDTKQFIVNGSCPSTNPLYPIGDQLLPKLNHANTSQIQPGGFIDLTFRPISHGDHGPLNLTVGQNLTAAFFHGLWNYSVPFTVTDPSVFRAQLPNLTSFSGELMVALTDKEVVQNAEDVIAGPLLIEIDDSLLIGFSQ